ncbi:MAG TPA: PHB depolymerase family esterase [Gemmataceae bacterium]
MPSANRVSWYRCFPTLIFLTTILPLALGVPPAGADLFIFKDGTAIEGRVKREMTLEFDQVARDAYYMPHGFFFLDDGPRRIFFCPSQVGRILEKDPPTEEKIARKTPLRGQVRPMKFPGLFAVAEAPEWNSTWGRRFIFITRNSQGQMVRVNVPQDISFLTPYWAEVQSRGTFFWGCAYLTRELGPETAQSLLAAHPDLQDNKNLPADKRASMRLRKADFFAQAGFLDLAEKELERILADLPEQKERVETARKTLLKLRAIERIEEIKRRHLAGQHRHVRRLLEDFSTRGVPERQIATIEELEHEYKETDQLIKETARLLLKAREGVRGTDNAVLREAAEAIHEDLNFENISRLDAFLGQARQAERLQKAGKNPEISPDQLLSLAVSGWLLGSVSAEMSVETARRLWHGREMVLSYLRSDDANKRQQLVQRHQAGSRTESASLDELIQIIHTLPPVTAEKKLPDGVAEFKTQGATYYVQLPPEYRHSRPYPVLIVLHEAGEKPSDMIQRWADAAAENGYILLAPEWQGGGNGKYNYSEEEHATVVNALRDLRRRFNTDEDRVFLSGLGEGGAMAYDVGLGHPDLFAGVLPMGAAPAFHSVLCWRNAQKLPFYVVYGSQGPDHEKLKDLFNNWVILRAYSQLWIDYKGRGAEWYAGEVSNMFDWMRSKRRERDKVVPNLGSSGHGGQFGNEFCTLRASDNHFYWISCDDNRNTKNLNNWSLRNRVQPAALSARIDAENSKIYVDSSGAIGQITIWLGRTSKGKDMIDFDKPVTVIHNLSLVQKWANRRISPSLDVLLEDLAQRGDRQQLFLAKITLQLLKQK